MQVKVTQNNLKANRVKKQKTKQRRLAKRLGKQHKKYSYKGDKK